MSPLDPPTDEEKVILERALQWAHDQIGEDPERDAEFLEAWDEDYAGRS